LADHPPLKQVDHERRLGHSQVGVQVGSAPPERDDAPQVVLAAEQGGVAAFGHSGADRGAEAVHHFGDRFGEMWALTMVTIPGMVTLLWNSVAARW
jgi:hypothetical protein